MAAVSRFGTGLLLLGGLILSGLLAYAVWLDPARVVDGARLREAVPVAVVMPEWGDWLDFVEAAQDGPGRSAPPRVTEIVLESKSMRRLRLFWVRARGVVETREAIRQLRERPDPPLAVIGSSNTRLTAALADAMAEQWPAGRGGPVLIVPWATSIRADLTSGRAPDTPLLERYPGRTFRFGPNNDAMAELVVSCVRDHDAPPPRRAVVLEDPSDPYSADLASSFRSALERLVPGARLEVRKSYTGSRSASDVPGPEEAQLARELWSAAAEAPTWLVLPLQGEPTRRVVAALGATAPSGPRPSLHVLSGDGVGLRTLDLWRESLPVPVSAFSSDVCPDPSGTEAAQDHQVIREILQVLGHLFQKGVATPDALATSLQDLELDAIDGRSATRVIAFEPGGERRNDGLGVVLALRPGSPAVLAYTRAPGGGWNLPAPIEPARPRPLAAP